MTLQKQLRRIRTACAQPWLVVVSTVLYVVSQGVMAAAAGPIGPDVLVLQVTGFTSEAYVEVFSAWQSAGHMARYSAAQTFDALHWIWYTVLLVAACSYVLERAKASARADLLLVLPLVAGPCDVLENTIQSVFLSAPNYAMVVDPLPAISTVASILKWSLVGVTLVACATLFVRGRRTPPTVESSTEST